MATTQTADRFPRVTDQIGTVIPATFTLPGSSAYGTGARTFDVVDAFEVGPGMRSFGWTHMLCMLPANSKRPEKLVERHGMVTVVDGKITRAQKPMTMRGTF